MTVRSEHIAKVISNGEELRLFYIDSPPSPLASTKGVILLIHGFPQTSYQYRHVLEPLSDAGYRLIAPDTRGHGMSSKPLNGYTKRILAEDLYHLLYGHLNITHPIYVIGHDIGGMIAHAFASLYPSYVKALTWGECPLPGSAVYEETKGSRQQFHFSLQSQVDLAVHLVTGREKAYLKHFYDKLSYNASGIPPDALEHYTLMYSQPGALRAAFAVYDSFENDAEENLTHMKEHGKVKIPTLGLCGAKSGHAGDMEKMLPEAYENYEIDLVPNAGHYIAEENPEAFVSCVIGFLKKH